MYGFYRMIEEVNKALPPSEERFPKWVDNRQSFQLIRAHSKYCPQSRTQWWTGALLIACFIFAIAAISN